MHDLPSLRTISAVAILAVLGCGRHHSSQTPRPASPAAKEAALSQDDRSLIEAALLELLKEPMTAASVARKKKIVLWNSTVQITDMPSDGKVGNHEIPGELWQSLSIRNREPRSLNAFQPESESIIVRASDPESDDLAFLATSPDSRYWAQVALPGYSQDRRSALVVVEFGPTMHGSFARFWFKSVSSNC